mmetsp:Transcript_115352/g.246526  ORF Transcript_115352/g.246526 Transcript_115352/m.246526 type:complete len:97 (-) Transcript_115352:867-1157(-)
MILSICKEEAPNVINRNPEWVCDFIDPIDWSTRTSNDNRHARVSQCPLDYAVLLRMANHQIVLEYSYCTDSIHRQCICMQISTSNHNATGNRRTKP